MISWGDPWGLSPEITFKVCLLIVLSIGHITACTCIPCTTGFTVLFLVNDLNECTFGGSFCTDSSRFQWIASLTVCGKLRMEGKPLELLNHAPGVFEYLWFLCWIAREMSQYKTNVAKNVGIF